MAKAYLFIAKAILSCLVRGQLRFNNMPKITKYIAEIDSKDLRKQHTDALPLTCSYLLQCRLNQGYFRQWIIIPHYSYCKVVSLESNREYINKPGTHSDEGMSLLCFTESMQNKHLIISVLKLLSI